MDFLNTCWKNFRTTKSIKIRPLQAEVFDAVRHDEAYAYSHFSQFWERAENIPDKTYVKPLPNTVPDSVELVRFYTRIYQLPLQWGYSVNCIEQSGINGNNCFKYIYVICMCVGMYVCIKINWTVFKFQNVLNFVHKLYWSVAYDSRDEEWLV